VNEIQYIMSRYTIELAAPEDDAALRSVLARTPMAGRISVAFGREPSFFGAAAVEGRFHQVVLGRDRESRHVVGFGVRSVGERYVNGCPEPVGYLSGLRILPEHRQGALLARGYRFFRELHADARAHLYLTTIAEGNRAALDILASGRGGLPAYHPAGRYHTVALPLRRAGFRPAIPAGFSVRSATAEDLAGIVEFLNVHGPARQFFPVYRADDFQNDGGLLRGLAAGDVLLCLRGSTLVGVLAGWDQHAFRQTLVCGYSGSLHWARPVYNAWARLAGRPELPAPGNGFRSLTAALPVVVDSDPRVLAALVGSLLVQARSRSVDYVLLGLHEADSLWPAARKFGGTRYTTRLFLVCWEDGESARRRLDGRVPYLELGSL
jgi:hypothetical protein